MAGRNIRAPAGRRRERQQQQHSEAQAFYTVYYKPPPDPRARRRRRIFLRISSILSLAAMAAGPIMFGYLRAQSECSVDVHCISPNQWLLRKSRDGASVKRKNETSTLLIVAHPEDEIVWAGEFLRRYGKQVHVMITSTRQQIDDSQEDIGGDRRSDVFRLASDKYGFSGEFLWGLDRYTDGPWELERSIRRRITSRVCDRPWDAIVTHGHDGEFGHPQHQAVHDAVVAAVYYCCNSTNRLQVFQHDPLFEGQPYSENMKTRRGRENDTEQRLFGNWTEHIVPYDEFDSELAEKTCRTYQKSGQGSKDTCRGGGDSDSSDLFRQKLSFRAKGYC